MYETNDQQTRQQRAPYTPPTIQSEPLFESNALESAGKNAELCDVVLTCLQSGCLDDAS